MTVVTIPVRQRAALRSNQYMRNGAYPSAYAQAYMQEEANHALWVRSKQVGRWTCPIQSIPAPNSAGSTVNRWRFATHAGSHASRFYARMIAARSYTDGADAEPFVRLLIELDDGTDVGTIDFHMSNVQKSSDTPNEWSEFIGPLRDTNGDIVELTPDTDYFGTFIDNDGGRLISATVYETSLAADTDNGYLPDGPVAGGPVFDEDRGDLITALRTAWKRNSATLFHWASNTDSSSITRTSATRANWLDQSLTTVTASSPGVSLQLANKGTVRRAGVPAKLWVYGSVGAGGPAYVSMRDSNGVDFCEVEIGDPAAQWWESNIELLTAADDTKLDVYIESDGTHTAEIFAVSLLQYET